MTTTARPAPSAGSIRLGRQVDRRSCTGCEGNALTRPSHPPFRRNARGKEGRARREERVGGKGGKGAHAVIYSFRRGVRRVDPSSPRAERRPDRRVRSLADIKSADYAYIRGIFTFFIIIYLREGHQGEKGDLKERDSLKDQRFRREEFVSRVRFISTIRIPITADNPDYHLAHRQCPLFPLLPSSPLPPPSERGRADCSDERRKIVGKFKPAHLRPRLS